MARFLASFYAFALASNYFLTVLDAENLDAFSEAVLVGNYGSMGPPFNKMMKRIHTERKNSGGEMAGRSMPMMAGGETSVDPNALIELSEGRRFPLVVVKEGIEALMEGAKASRSTSPGGTNWIMDCMRKLAMCAMLSVSNVRCYDQCMLAQKPALKKIRHILPQKIHSMCDPMGTIFDKIIERLEPKVTEIKRLDQFMELFDTGVEHFKSYAHKASCSLLAQIINNINKPQMYEKRRCMKPLRRSLGLASTSFKMPNSMSNEGCKNISLMETTMTMVDVLSIKPALTDMLLNGYMLAKTIAQHVPGPQQSMFSAFHDVVNFAAGAPCGIIHYAETGEKLECDEKGDGSEEPIISTLPAQYTGPDPYRGACGTIPEFPSFDMNMGFQFPKAAGKGSEEAE